ncbi:hypothetical protein [Rhizobium sp. BK538]|nr:hypothetical protein [Rhizobium sp. BK538]MBB4169007.1 hypothetical protein [Rhizobium sp. BK538]
MRKLIGDGTLAIFKVSHAEESCAAPLRAYHTLHKNLSSSTTVAISRADQ